MMDTVLRMQGITKSFPGVLALAGVDFDVLPGEVHSLVGHNGAGKSTLIKIMSGAYTKDGGHMYLKGQEVSFSTPAASQQAGIATIYQEVNLVPFRTAPENIFYGREPMARFGRIDWSRMRREARELLDGLGIQIDLNVPVMQLGVALQQMVSLARAVSLRASLLVMDEPTSSLDTAEVKVLFGVIERLKKSGVGMIYVSHRMDEIFALSDRVTVLRNGQLVATMAINQTDELTLVAQMMGRNPDEVRASGLTAFSETGAAHSTETMLEVEHLTRGRAPDDVSLRVGKGEIVGLAGLLGSGRTELARTIFGADRADRGTVQGDRQQAGHTVPPGCRTCRSGSGLGRSQSGGHPAFPERARQYLAGGPAAIYTPGRFAERTPAQDRGRDDPPAGYSHAQSSDAGAQPIGRQSAEGDPGALALPQSQAADPGRANARH